MVSLISTLLFSRLLGHTYERAAIARWLNSSNKSPMTGMILTHKELVTNYGLMSSVQEAATRSTLAGAKSDIPLRVEVDDNASAALSETQTLGTLETVLFSPPAQRTDSPASSGSYSD